MAKRTSAALLVTSLREAWLSRAINSAFIRIGTGFVLGFTVPQCIALLYNVNRKYLPFFAHCISIVYGEYEAHPNKAVI